MNVLLVSDSPDIKLIVRKVLKNEGHELIFSASSAKEALEMLGTDSGSPKNDIDLIVMDLAIPLIDGIEACRVIRELSHLKDIPVIMLMDQKNDDLIERVLEAGADDFVAKPISQAELRTRVRVALRLRTEIKERKEKEDSLLRLAEEFKKSSERLSSFEKAINSMQIGLTITGIDGKIIYSNPAEAKMHKYSQDELLGEDVRIFAPKEFWKPRDSKKFSKAVSFQRETVNVKKDGFVFPVRLLSDVVCNEKGDPVALVSTCEDITERKRAEKAFKKSEEQFRLVVDKSPIPTVVTDKEGNIEHLNNKFIDVFGWTTDDVRTSEEWWNAAYPDNTYRREVQRSWEKAVEKADIAGEEIETQEWEVTCKNGEMRSVEFSMVPVSEEQSLITMIDITERKHLDEQLKSEKGFTDDAINAQRDTFFLFDISNGKALRWNNAFRDLSGYSDEEISTMKAPGDWYDSEDLLKSADALKKITEVGQGKIELSLVAKDGKRIPTEYNASVINDENGLPKQIISIGRDITERKQAEEALKKVHNELENMVTERTSDLIEVNRTLKEEVEDRKNIEKSLTKSEKEYKRLYQQFTTLLDAIPDALLLLSPDLEVQWSNAQAPSTFGKKDSNMTGRLCYDICQKGDSPDEEKCPSKRSFKTGHIENAEVFTLDKRLLDVRAFPIKNSRGEVINVIEVATDITEKVKLQVETVRAGHLASIGELSAGVAHEINNPINGIINCAQILQSKYCESGKSSELVGMIMAEGRRIARIVQALLSFSREKGDKRTLFDLNTVIDDSLALTEAYLRKESIKLQLDIASDLPLVRGDDHKIEQVFLNLINNARYALNQKYPKKDKDKLLKITGEKVEVKGEENLRVTFFDNGPGIPKDIRDKILEPFFSTKPSKEGTGLGLSISHGIIEDHGGSLSVKSREGHYTKIIIDLPSGGGSET